ncbi:uncharacterized protein LACBIDRAFT_304051 [Laccaria bicolor S238N-H82]|uniref:Predicted protein n=1 Tax=Laccaria bicolor (strain S238N-H82 / ATCC MYA-4686) TaxID=486041 RepID=B0DKU8_LACBS|nr:uncharacterized protein LACBIDRAFT_304051 [Laccaria bicolor S238N-H82]EDR04709.1 predicted protein [Laccaria bicolor S238N-H82]|eukprot:XP_001884533.1 predicted protein [Laccaria bicolor S238N-H82]
MSPSPVEQQESEQRNDKNGSQTSLPLSKVPRRTPMACQFCRGRKLKCDGNRPSCSNCDRRSLACQYTPVSAQR